MPILFPRPFAFAVDDLGWNEGSDLSQNQIQGPHRAGVKRVFDIHDYQSMVAVGKAVGTRIQCLFILSEMDRENVLAKFPTTTYLRDKWNNSNRVNPDQVEIMNYVRDQAAYMEFGLHGTGHEYWAPGEPQKRAEWYNLTDKKPWPEQSLREHLECFKKIMSQYGFTKENGHSFPESFVPCAYSYYWNPTGAYSLGKLLSEVGVKYANTDFSQIPELNPPKELNGGGFDFGTHVVNRINYGNSWYQLDKLPTVPIQDQDSDIIESHWPNWLAQDDFLQAETNARWIDYYKSVQRMPDRYIAKNTEQFHSQWLYKAYTTVTEMPNGSLEIDNTRMNEKAYTHHLLGNMVLKVKLEKGQHLSSALLNGVPIPAYFEDQGFGFLYLPPLEKKRYSLTYFMSGNLLPLYVNHSETSNIYDLTVRSGYVQLKIRIYGEQSLTIKCDQPKRVLSKSENLKINFSSYDSGARTLKLVVKGTDMQGSTGNIEVQY
ncbi:MAG: hypothetical protein J0L67_03550 [Cytophagales bacterium]|nr:hypothetical protein [Cytophagales bacterium]